MSPVVTTFVFLTCRYSPAFSLARLTLSTSSIKSSLVPASSVVSSASACDHTYPNWYASRHTCCSNAALVGGIFSIVREHCANNSFPASCTPLAEHFLLYMTTMNLSIFYRISELTFTGCRYRSRKAYVTDGQELHADFFPRPRKVDTVSHPLTAWKNINAFSLHIPNRVDSNMSKVNTGSKANPEFIKPKRQEIPIARTTHLCLWFGLLLCAVLVVHNAQRGAECAYLLPHGNMAGDTRRRSCHSVWRLSFHPLC